MSRARKQNTLSRAYIRKACGLVVALLIAGCAGNLLAQDIPDDFGPPVVKARAVYSSPEHFSVDEEWAAFREHAHEFLQKHPDHVLAPRALHDLILIQGLRAKPDVNETNALKVRLVFEYPESFATSVTMRSFKDAAEYRNLLIAEFRKPDQKFTNDFCRQFLKAGELGLNLFGPQFAVGDDYLLLVGLALNEGKSFRLKQALEVQWEKMKEPTRSGHAICRQAELGAAQKVVGLHQIVSNTENHEQSKLLVVRDAERFWMSRLTPQDHLHPQIRAVEIEMKLAVHKFAEVLADVDALLALEQQPQWIFWRAWCLANVERPDEALAALETMKVRFPDDTWTKHGSHLAELIRGRDEAIREHAAVIQEIIETLYGDRLEVLNVKALYTPPKGKPFELWTAADSNGNSLDLFLHRDGQPLVGYKSTLQSYAFFLSDKPEAIVVDKPGMFPALTLGFSQTPAGLKYEFNMNMYSTAAAAKSWRHAISGIIANPLLADETAIQGMLRQSALTSGFPLRIRTVDQRRIISWNAPQVNKPQMDVWEIELAPKGTNELQIRIQDSFKMDIKYGRKGTLPSFGPYWDRLSIVKKDDLDFSVMLQAMSLASKWFAEEPENTQSVVPTRDVPPSTKSSEVPPATTTAKD